MTAVLIPVSDLFYVQTVKNSKGEHEPLLTFNSGIMTEELLNILKRVDTVLYVLLPCEATSLAEIELPGAMGVRIRKPWRTTLLPLLKNMLEPMVDRRLTIQGSFDLAPVNGEFFPRDCRWMTGAHSRRLLFTYLTPRPTQEALLAYRLQHFQFLSSYLALPKLAQGSLSLANDLQSRQINGERRNKVLVICDVDHSLLDNLFSTLSQVTHLNEAVVEAVAEIVRTIERHGAEAELLAMSARPRSLDQQFALIDHPYAMPTVVNRLGQRLQRSILFDEVRSYSYPEHSKGIKKTRKLEHLLSLLDNELIDHQLSNIVLLDDCAYECEQEFIRSVSEFLFNEYGIRLHVLQVDRFGYSQPTALASIAMQLDAPSTQASLVRRWSLCGSSTSDEAEATPTLAHSAPR